MDAHAILLVTQYDGGQFAGWQRQINAPSVQQVIEVDGQGTDLVPALDLSHPRVQRPSFDALHGLGHLFKRP